ncbi:MAG TPA: ABC transporter ATP-binding protein, partial [Elusimicrobiales bacterium]|nr:ABC transporter ATP-binding protein [Elusimicrobiales bacterium]
MTDPILSIENVSGGYGAADVVRNVSLSVPEGSILGLIGPNGSGKTTLLRLAGKALKPRAGRVRFRGRDISAVPLREFCREVAFVPQDIEVNFSFTVMELVLMGRIPHLR